MSTTTLCLVRCTVRSVKDLAGGSSLSLFVPAAMREGGTASPADCTDDASGADFDASAGGGASSLAGASALRVGAVSATVGSIIGWVGAQACRVPSSTAPATRTPRRSEEHTSELQSQSNLVCRLLLEKKKKTHDI